MGNRLNTNVTSGVKQQAAGSTGCYMYVDLKGGGKLVELTKKANRTKNYTELDETIQNELKQYLYNDGQGKVVPIREIIAVRCEGKRFKMDAKNNNLEVTEFEAMTDDDSGYLKKHGSQYKEVCWRLDNRGGVGETPLHVCLLNATSIHADLAKRLLRIYPKLICDIFLSDEYYGENVLHMAIVNEDPAVVKFLLDHGADCHQRCCGNFFTADDQKESRRDSWEHEWFDMNIHTDYGGLELNKAYMSVMSHLETSRQSPYWGEYPLGFAACLGQEECVRLLIAKGADPNLQDSNGNTVLHMLVVHDKKVGFL